MAKINQKIVTHLWYAKGAAEAAKFYAGIFPDSRVDKVTTMPAESPSGPEGSVSIVELTLFGQAFMAIEAGPHHDFNDAISLLVRCESQEELDRYYGAILEGGGKEQMCGWVIDRWGLRWQIHPTALDEMMTDPDPVKAKRVTQAMLKQKKFDIAKLRAAFDGK